MLFPPRPRPRAPPVEIRAEPADGSTDCGRSPVRGGSQPTHTAWASPGLRLAHVAASHGPEGGHSAQMGEGGRRAPLTPARTAAGRQQPHSLRHRGSNGARVEQGTIVIASFPVCRTPGNNLIFHNFSEALLTLPFLF